MNRVCGLRHVFVVALFFASGCYSFSGNALPPHVKTIAIPIFGDESRSGIPLLRENLTKVTTEKIQAQTPLIIEQNRAVAHSVIEAVIASVTDAPSVVSGSNERATRNRITITIQATYRDLVKGKKLFQKTLSGFEDYEVGSLQGRNAAIQAASAQLTDLLVNEVLSGW
ncbi:MAG: LPS assembly lipoprotein LptE [Chloroherpetonaceae bacterium]|nr:LPS assembly lipoprotein LptE [Chloroherpetonaceae bacterium]MDW8436644.1 LPS assembly lipoprotein LptE [Chloroherpetonaceae bacterium]